MAKRYSIIGRPVRVPVPMVNPNSPYRLVGLAQTDNKRIVMGFFKPMAPPRWPCVSDSCLGMVSEPGKKFCEDCENG